MRRPPTFPRSRNPWTGILNLVDESSAVGEPFFFGGQAQRTLIVEKGISLAVEGFLTRLYLSVKGGVFLLYLVLLCGGLIVFL